MIAIHNKVNSKLGVPKCNIPSFEEVKKKYEAFRAKCSKTTKRDVEENLKSKCNLKNANKGCVIPKDGVLKKCEIKIISSGDENSFRNH